METPEYILKQIRRTHRGSIREWWSFRYAPLPNEFSRLMLLMIGFFLIYDLALANSEISLINRLLGSAINLVLIDIIMYWWFTNCRIVLAFQKYKRGENWQSIHPWDVDMR